MNYNIKKDKSQDLILLKDKNRFGKVRPWKQKKQDSLKLAYSYERLEYKKYYDSVLDCGSILRFEVEVETGNRYLKNAWFCKKRLCPMCNWRRTKKIFSEVSRVMDVVQSENLNLKALFLTLTQQNCDFDDLINGVDDVLKGWTSLTKHKIFERQIKGYFRALEITYNEKTNSWHPHIHTILLVEQDYFRKDNKEYVTTEKWSNLWKCAMKLDYNPIVDVRRAYNSKRKQVAEVAKYTSKSTDYLKKDLEKTDELVLMLTSALHRRRLFMFGGVMKEVASRLGNEIPGEGDLIHVDGDSIRGDVAKLEEIYSWDFGIKNYVRVK